MTILTKCLYGGVEMYIYFMILIPFAIIGIRILLINYQLKKTSYQESSGNNLWKILFDKGNYGEFLIYRILEISGEKRILCNVYLETHAGKSTEIDMISINTSGVFVYESKNYSGWIFGDEKNKNWTQTLPNRQKSKFYNPISQNKGHIKAINNLLNNGYSDAFFSYIIFSERCELKKITFATENVRVFKRSQLARYLRADKLNGSNRLTVEEVDKIYYALKQHSLVSDEVKQKHIEQVKNTTY